MGSDRLDNPSILNQYSRPGVVVRRGAGQPSFTNVLPIVFDIIFDEPVVDLPIGRNVGGIVFSGTATGLHYEVVGEKANYQVTIRAIDQDGSVMLSVPAELTADLFGNVNRASEGDEAAVVYYDDTRPRSVIQSEQEGVMNEAQMQIALVFSERVFGLRDDALSLENATVTRLSGAEGDLRYDFAVRPRADGTTALTLPQDAVFDAAGNGNEASPEFSFIVDSTGPEVALASFETPRASNSWVMRVHAVFSEPVRGFEKRDVSIQGGSLLNFTARDDGITYLFDVKPSEGEVRLVIPGGVAQDIIGNPNNASEVFLRKVDRTGPTVSLQVGEAQAGRSVPVEVSFSEPVYGFDDSALRVNRGIAHRTGGRDGDHVYYYLVAPSGKRTVEVQVPSGVATDLAGNENKRASVRFTPTITAPTDDGGEAGREAPPPGALGHQSFFMGGLGIGWSV